MDSSSQWLQWMKRALQLASLGEGSTSPNPLVGAVVLSDEGKLVGEGFHARAGEAHAEIGALSQAGSKAEKGTLIVTLEPCSHHGRTPPCAEAIVKSGIAKVVIALEDPDPRVSGSGISRLKEAGIEVITGLLEHEAAYQNRAFLFRVKTGRPWGTLKWAMTLDGRTALSNGLSKWISSKESRKYVHSLRSKFDAVIVGGETVRKDNPLLTSRGLRCPEPLRVVFTKTCDLPSDAQLWDTSVAETLIAHGPKNINSLHKLVGETNLIELTSSSPLELIKDLGCRGCNRVLWECGPRLATVALQEGCVQEIQAFISPKLIGGLPAKTVLNDLGFTTMKESLKLEDLSMQKIGGDWLLNGSFLL